MDMDQFNIPHQKVKEKSVYMLHLDAARIILISAAVIGIIIVSFLLGMNFIKGGDGARNLVTKNDIFDGQKELDLLKNNIPDPPDEDDLSKPMDDKLVPSEKGDKSPVKEKADPDNHAVEKEKKDDISAISKNESSDMLTRDNFNDVVIKGKNPKKKAVHDSDEAKKVSRSSEQDISDKPVKKATVKNDSKKKKRGKSKVVAVAVEKVDERKAGHSGNYAIQVGSFDKKSKAQSEVTALKDLNYDAYLDESLVKGKQYYRVRIGPVASKKKALDLLKDVQDKEKYQESYMVRD
jgi:cell division septation protein DedD